MFVKYTHRLFTALNKMLYVLLDKLMSFRPRNKCISTTFYGKNSFMHSFACSWILMLIKPAEITHLKK